jgi:hypothetical protein
MADTTVIPPNIVIPFGSHTDDGKFTGFRVQIVNGAALLESVMNDVVVFTISGVVDPIAIASLDAASQVASATTKTASRAAQFGTAGVLESATVTTTELVCLSGVTSPIQSQLGAKAGWLGNFDYAPEAQEGDMYYDTTTTTAYLYTSSGWIAIGVV